MIQLHLIQCSIACYMFGVIIENVITIPAHTLSSATPYQPQTPLTAWNLNNLNKQREVCKYRRRLTYVHLFVYQNPFSKRDMYICDALRTKNDTSRMMMLGRLCVSHKIPTTQTLYSLYCIPNGLSWTSNLCNCCAVTEELRC